MIEVWKPPVHKKPIKDPHLLWSVWMCNTSHCCVLLSLCAVHFSSPNVSVHLSVTRPPWHWKRATGHRIGTTSLAGGLAQGERIKSFIMQGHKERFCSEQRSDTWVVLLGVHEHGKIHRELGKRSWPRWRLLCFSVKGLKPSCSGFANFSQWSWASAIPLAKRPAPSYSHLHRHKALAVVSFKAPTLCLRPKATFPKAVQAQSCDWSLSWAVSRLFSITATSQISEKSDQN